MNACLANAEWLRRQYLDERVPVEDIAYKAGCNLSTVWRSLHRHGIPLRGGGQDQHERLTRAYLEQQYVHQRRSMRSIALEVGCHHSVVAYWVGRYGFARGGSSRVFADPARVEELVRLHESGWSLARLAERYGCAEKTVRGALLASGVRMRRPGRPRVQP